MESAGIKGVCVCVCGGGVVDGRVEGEGQGKKVEWERRAGPKRGMKEREMGRKTGKNHGRRKEGLWRRAEEKKMLQR